MDRLKQISKYVLGIVAFFLFSNFLIYVGLNSDYEEMVRLDKTAEVDIFQAESTYINGRIRGTIDLSDNTDIIGKYLKIEILSDNNVVLGEKYIEIVEQQNEENMQVFEILYELKNSDRYLIAIVDEKPEVEELKLLPENLTQQQVVLGTIFAILIFWV